MRDFRAIVAFFFFLLTINSQYHLPALICDIVKIIDIKM